MNPNNYCTLEVSQRLVAKGIVLETDQYWSLSDKKLYPRSTIIACRSEVGKHVIPAPSMAELWRELPKQRDTYYTLNLFKYQGGGRIITCARYSNERDEDTKYEYDNPNPCDALASLLIWVRKEAGDD